MQHIPLTAERLRDLLLKIRAGKEKTVTDAFYEKAGRHGFNYEQTQFLHGVFMTLLDVLADVTNVPNPQFPTRH